LLNKDEDNAPAAWKEKASVPATPRATARINDFLIIAEI
jgi:hypothetical protein